MSVDPFMSEEYTMEDPLGLCHICQMVGQIKYCSKCDHWFCKKCRRQFFWRGLEALKELVKGRQPGCCGPLEERDE